MTDAELARLLGPIADWLDRAGIPGPSGIIRQAAQRLTTTRPDPGPDQCPTCAGPVTQPARGRRRVYCTPKCRPRSRNGREMVNSKP